MSVHVRRPASADVEALDAFLGRARARGDTAAASSWLGERFRSSSLDPQKAAVAVDETGLVAVIIPELKALIVEPERRLQGIGRRLVDTGLAIEREQGNGQLILGARPGGLRAEAFLRATAFTRHSSVFDLELVPGSPVPAPVLRAGYAPRPFRRDADVDEFSRVYNEAFAEHPTPMRIDPDTIGRWLSDPAFRDDDTILVIGPDDRIAAFVGTDPKYRPDGSLVERAEIWALGVRPDLRGLGLGRAALRLGTGWLRALGVDTVELTVSGLNPGAVALYEADGFVRTGERVRWSRPVEPVPA